MKKQKQMMRQEDAQLEATGILSISIDSLVQILGRLPDPADRKSFRLVAHTFARAEAVHRRELKILRREFLVPLLRRYPGLETLDLSCCPSFADEALAAAVSGGLRGLRRIDLSRASGVGWRGLDAMVAACPRLEEVDLSHCVGVGDREAAAVAAARGLRVVRLDKCLAVTDVGLARIAVGCPSLESLGIKWCREISDIGIDLLAKKCRELRTLDVSYLEITNRSLQSISSLPKMEVLLMVGCSHIDDEGLRYLNSGSNSLRIVDVSRCDNVTSIGLASVVEGQKCLEKLSTGDCVPEIEPIFLDKLSFVKMTLSTLKLDGFHVSVASLAAIGLSCKNLKEISLSKCSGVVDEGICHLVSNCVGLTSIDLTCCRLLTDGALFTIAKHCKNLESLWLESCSLFTEKGLDHISNSCTNLKEIDLTDCNVNDAALNYLSRCCKLMVLKLGLCPSITSEGLTHISSNCEDLRVLDLYRCTGINDDGLASLANGCKKLRKLNVCYCDEITDEGLKHLSSLKELTDLELRALNRISSIGIIAIAMGCSSLLELDVKCCCAVDDVAMCALAQYSPKIRQINISYCPVTVVGLWKLLGNLRCLQDVDLVHLTKVSVEGYEFALRASCGRLKKLKLLSGLRNQLSPGLLQMLHAQGCRLRCVDKPMKLE